MSRESPLRNCISDCYERSGPRSLDKILPAMLDGARPIFVLDGNHRLAAFVRINNELLVDKKPAAARRFESVEQTEIHLPFFLVDKVRVVRRYLENRQIKYPMDQVEKQTGFFAKFFRSTALRCKASFHATEHWNSVADVLKLFNKGFHKGFISTEKKSQKKVGVPEDYSKAHKVDNHLDLHSGQFGSTSTVPIGRIRQKRFKSCHPSQRKDVKSVELELKDVCPDLDTGCALRYLCTADVDGYLSGCSDFFFS
uniref:ParB/Sulfiredoxin domain-containing protein n=1 Tax=Ditylenchus dipsaci TaxID=166011 RepID=A0A915DP82_9BILA